MFNYLRGRWNTYQYSKRKKSYLKKHERLIALYAAKDNLSATEIAEFEQKKKELAREYRIGKQT